MATSKAVQAYPLSWPTGWKRTKNPGESKFKMPTSKAHSELLREIALFGGTSVVISTNCPLRQDGVMRMDREPVDTGVAVYFQKDGRGVSFPCDSYDLVAHNLRAIGVTIEAMRAIERHGSAQLLDRAFSGFKELNAENPGESWWKTLQLTADATEEHIQYSYRRLAKFAHPDSSGGSEAAMAALNAARDQGLNVARQKAGAK